MSATCPHGHESITVDYCDQCGTRIDGDSDGDNEVTITEEVTERPVPSDAERCPRCQTPRSGDDRFCEVDGYDFVIGAGTATPLRWEAVVTADRSYYDALAPDGVDFPASYEPRTFELTGSEMLVGRKSKSRGIEPEIDLAGSPVDDGISRQHASLVRCDDGSWALVDRGSANGTTVNGCDDVVPVDTPVPLADGDRIHIGAWTTITIRAVHPVVTDTTS